MTSNEELMQIYGENVKDAFFKGVQKGQNDAALELICKELSIDYVK